jgi:protein-S-isoprenylcysteine O-methyltransferase Ste14
MHHAGMFDVVFLAMFALCLVIRAPLEVRNKTIRAVESREGAFGKFCLLLVLTGSTALPLLYLFTPWFDVADYAVHPGVGGAGAALAVPAIVLFWKSHRNLVSRGIHRWIRHPMYTALFLIAAAQLLLIGNAVVGPAFLLAFSILYASRIEHEDDMVPGHFGQACADCKSRTRRLLPSFRQSRHGPGCGLSGSDGIARRNS